MSAQETTAPGTTSAETTPSDIERELGAIWAAQLGLAPEKVGLHRSFFELGGNSLSIMGVQTALRTTMGREVAIADLFQHPTIHKLARFIEGGVVPQTSRGAEFQDARDRMLKARGLRGRT